MKILVRTMLLLLLALISQTIQAQPQCGSCNFMICDGLTCDDGSPADGVQTSGNCGCGPEIDGACAMVTIDLTNNPYYNPNDPSCGLIMETQESGNFLIYFSNENCEVIDCQNPDFVVTNNQIIDNLPSTQVFTMMVCKEGGNAGRRDFNFSITCTSIENCVNAVDDDLDGFVDCDDQQCVLDAVCTYSSTSSANEGGLESNNRLASAIAQTQYTRSRLDQVSSVITPERLLEHDRSTGMRSELTMEQLIPIDVLNGAKAYESTPADLIDITNASAIFGVDYVVQGAPAASILCTQSEGGIYEHSKMVCDRLHGYRLVDTWNYPLDGLHPFVICKFERPNGSVEYATSFSVENVKANVFRLQSHWNVDAYPAASQYFNFQIWAQNTAHLETLVTGVLARVSSFGEMIEADFSPSPQVFARSVRYKNGQLILEIQNISGSSDLSIKGEMKISETSPPVPFTKEIELTGKLHETIVVDQKFQDLGFSLGTSQQLIPDNLYISDGTWGVDCQPGNGTVDHYAVTPSQSMRDLDARHIERDVTISGTVDNYVSVYRSLTAGFRPVDLSGFDLMTFTAKGSGQLEIHAIRSSIEAWEQQPRTSIALTEELRTYQLPIERLAPENDRFWNDVVMLVFTTRANGGVSQRYTVHISDLKFAVRDAAMTTVNEQSRLRAYPNPAQDQVWLDFVARQQGQVVYSITTPSGNVLQEGTASVSLGVNSLVMDVRELQEGMYFIFLRAPSGEIRSQKICLVRG